MTIQALLELQVMAVELSRGADSPISKQTRHAIAAEIKRCCGEISRHLTQVALDEGDSPAFEGVSTLEVLSAGQAGSTPALRQ